MGLELSYFLRDKLRVQSKIAKFPVYFLPAEWVPLGIGHQRWESKKTTMMWLPGRERSLSITSAILLQSTGTDRQMDDNNDRTYA